MKKIGWKLFYTYIVIIALCVILFSIFAISPLRIFYIDNLSSKLESNGLLISSFLYDELISNSVSSIKSKVINLGQKTNQRITIIQTTGKVLGDSEMDPILMENHADRLEIKTALEGKTGQSIRYSNTLDMDMLYVAVPIKRNQQIIGVTRISTPLNLINRKIQDIQKIIFFSALFALFIASAISLFVSLRITRPLRQMSIISKEIAKGNFQNKLKISSKDEIGELSDTLNEMSVKLEDKIREISEDKSKIETVLSSVVEGIAAIDKKGKIILYNHAFENIVDFPREKAFGKFHWEIIRNNTINELIKNTLENRKTITREINVLFPYARTFTASIAPLEAEKNVLGIVLVLNDISKIKKLEQMRSEFVANVSHELRTPLTSIQGFVETLKEEKMDNPDKIQHFLKIIERQSNRLNNIIEDLLHLSKIESREVKMDLHNINLEKLIKKIVQEYKERIDSKKHKINLNFSSGLPLVKVDMGNIELVLSNLLNNAILYTPEHGTISIAVSERINDIYISVSDNGIGISEEHLPRIFERFYRVNKDRSRELGGTGLGLAIVKHIVKAHHGDIGVKSQPGKGSTFYFTLPKRTTK